MRMYIWEVNVVYWVIEKIGDMVLWVKLTLNPEGRPRKFKIQLRRGEWVGHGGTCL